MGLRLPVGQNTEHCTSFTNKKLGIVAIIAIIYYYIAGDQPKARHKKPPQNKKNKNKNAHLVIDCRARGWKAIVGDPQAQKLKE